MNCGKLSTLGIMWIEGDKFRISSFHNVPSAKDIQGGRFLLFFDRITALRFAAPCSSPYARRIRILAMNLFV